MRYRHLPAPVRAIVAHRRGLLRCCLLACVCAVAVQVRAQFELQDSTTTASLRGIASPGNGVAWASGTNGTVLRTEDSGFVWQGCAMPPGAEKLDFRGVQAFDAQTALVMSSGKGDLSRVYKTTNGCRTWTRVFTNPDAEGFFDAMQFAGTQRGMILGDPVLVKGAIMFSVFETQDGGKSWSSITKDGAASGLQAKAREAAFAASNASLLYRTPFGTLIGTGGPNGAELLFGADGQVPTLCLCVQQPPAPATKPPTVHGPYIFQRRPVPMARNGSAGVFAIALRPSAGTTKRQEPELVAVGGDYTLPDTTAGTAAYAEHLLLDWHAATTPPHGYRSSVAYDVANKTWITVGPNGTDLSRDGRNWSPLLPGAGDAADADKQWNALALPFVVGLHGRIGRLRDDALQAK